MMPKMNGQDYLDNTYIQPSLKMNSTDMNEIFAVFTAKKISVSSFISYLIENPPLDSQIFDLRSQAPTLIKKLMQYSTPTIDLKHKWLPELVSNELRNEMQALLDVGDEWETTAAELQAGRIHQFRVDKMAGKIEETSPFLWEILDVLLSTCHETILGPTNAGVSDEDKDLSLRIDTDLGGVVQFIQSGSGKVTPTAKEQNSASRKKATILIKKVLITNVIMRSLTRNIKGLETFIEIFLQACKPPGKLFALPPEIMSHIFILAKQSLDSTDARLLPLELAQVTRRWRDIAIGTVPLWTDIDISPCRSLNIISTYLTRSKHSLIDLTFITRDGSCPNANALFTLIAPHFTRCRSIYIGSRVYIGSYDEDLMDFIGLFSSYAFPQLRQFSLDRTSCAEIAFALNAPRLTCLRLSGTRTFVPKLTLGGLTTLHLSFPLTYKEFTKIIAAAPTLSTLALVNMRFGNWPDQTWRSTFSGVTLPIPALRSLQLYGQTLSSESAILLTLSAPGLTELVIAPVSVDYLTVLQRAPNGHNKFPMLQNLIIASGEYSLRGILQPMAECFPSVKHLVFANVFAEGFDQMFKPLISGNRTMPWPNLESIALRNIGEGMDDLISRMLYIRKGSGHALREVKLDPESCARYPELLREIQEGVNIRRVDTWKEYREDTLYWRPGSLFSGEEKEENEDDE